MCRSLLWLVVVFLSLFGLSKPTIATPHAQMDSQDHDTEETTQWPSLLWHFKFKRKTKNVFGKTRVSIYTNPVVSSNNSTVYYYDALATWESGNSVFNYTLIDGVAYLSVNYEVNGDPVSVVQCLKSELDDFPPINSIVAAINRAKPVSNLSTNTNGAVKCKTGNLFKVSFESSEFALCAASSRFVLYGSDVDIVVEYLDEPVNIVQPELTGSSSDNCVTEMSPTILTSIGTHLLTGELSSQDESRSWKTTLANLFEDKPSCSCKSISRPCIFIHGLGVKSVEPVNEDSLPYWGNISDHAPCCSLMKFAHLNTVNNSWTSMAQQENVCDRALAVSDTSKNSIIRDTIVVTHSMGGLMLAGAISNGLCSLDSSSTWVSMAAPMTGSMGSDYAQEACAGKANFIAEKLVNHRHECPINQAIKSLAYEGGNYSSKTLNAAYKLAQDAYRTNVSAVMCSESYSGILSSYEAYFWMLGRFIPHKSKHNDGVVEFQSCANGLDSEKFGDDYTSRFYRTKLNHYDMQFRAGDAVFNKAKMPVKWFECLL